MTAGRRKENIVKRVTRLILLLRERRAGVSVREVARELECCHRTAYRYLSAIECAGLPLVVETVDVVEERAVYAGSQKAGGPTKLTKMQWGRMTWKLVEGWR